MNQKEQEREWNQEDMAKYEKWLPESLLEIVGSIGGSMAENQKVQELWRFQVRYVYES
jgi:hypothetical protein